MDEVLDLSIGLKEGTSVVAIKNMMIKFTSSHISNIRHLDLTEPNESLVIKFRVAWISRQNPKL